MDIDGRRPEGLGLTFQHGTLSFLILIPLAESHGEILKAPNGIKDRAPKTSRRQTLQTHSITQLFPKDRLDLSSNNIAWVSHFVHFDVRLVLNMIVPFLCYWKEKYSKWDLSISSPWSTTLKPPRKRMEVLPTLSVRLLTHTRAHPFVVLTRCCSYGRQRGFERWLWRRTSEVFLVCPFLFWLSKTNIWCIGLFSDYRGKAEHRVAGPDTRSKQNTIRLEKVKKDDNSKKEVKKTEQEQKESDELEKRAKAKAEKKKN